MLSRFSSHKFPETLSSGGGVEKSRGLTEGAFKEHELPGWGIESWMGLCVYLAGKWKINIRAAVDGRRRTLSS